jgi:flagellar basal-body rod protein FlgG
VLQQAGGGDLTLDGAAVTVAADGTVLDGDRPVGRVGVFRSSAADGAEAIDGSVFSIAEGAAEAMDPPSLRQGALEASNVSLGDEMVGMMAALRGAETGAKLVQVYDNLMGKAITTFGQGETMSDAFYVGAVGLQAQERALDVIGSKLPQYPTINRVRRPE